MTARSDGPTEGCLPDTEAGAKAIARTQSRELFAARLARRRPWRLGTVLAWVIWRDEKYLDRITNYSQWDSYAFDSSVGSRALDAWRQVLGKIHDGELAPIEDDGTQQSRRDWFRILDNEVGAETAFGLSITLDREQVKAIWPPGEGPNEAREAETGADRSATEGQLSGPRGKGGRPSDAEIVKAEAKRRLKAGLAPRTLAEFSRQLQDWLDGEPNAVRAQKQAKVREPTQSKRTSDQFGNLPVKNRFSSVYHRFSPVYHRSRCSS
jgi:hypothetical protein